MGALSDAPGVVMRVGSWSFQPGLNQLRNADAVIQLEPKAAMVLKLLAERAGELVTRQELLDSVWADVVVSDDALTQVVIKLRKALGDSARDPRYIQTIPKRGYCLLADVQVEPGNAQGHAASHARGMTAAAARPAWWAVASTVLLVAVMIVYLGLDGPSSYETTGDVVDGAIRPDGATLTVMPFGAITGSERETRFARGIHADLVTDLGGLPDLAIISPSLNNPVSARSRYQVDGDVQQVGDRISVSIRLVDSGSARLLWSQRYDRKLDDVFEVQRSISHDVVRHLALKVPAADLQRLASRYTPSLVAYEDFLRGQAELLRRGREANAAARSWYRKAIEHDPGFARAYAGLALSYAADYRNHWAEDGQRALQSARDMAQTGVQIDPNIAEVYWVLGYVATQNRRHEDALAHLRRALEVDHSYADAYALMGGINTYIGRPELSIVQLRKAMHLDQDAGYLYYLLLGRAYYFTGRLEQAMINLRESLARNPANLETHIYLLATAVSRDDGDTADWEAEEIRVIEPGFAASVWLETYPMTDRAQRDVLAAVLARVET